MRFLSLIMTLALLAGFVSPVSHAGCPTKVLLASTAVRLERLQKIWKSKDYAKTIHRDIDARRLINDTDWNKALKSKPKQPWNYYGESTLREWLRALNFVQENVQTAELSVDLLKKIHKIATQSHYFLGFEKRRITQAFKEGKLTNGQVEKLFKQIDEGVFVHFSGTHHASLAGQFRSSSIDDFVHTGESFLPSGQRYMSAYELDRLKSNPYLKLNENTLIELEKGKFTGEVHFPASIEVTGLVDQVIAKAVIELQKNSTLEEKVHTITRLQQELISIHPFLDGNGRTIRLLADLLYMKEGFPPPLQFSEMDLFMAHEELFDFTIESMGSYVRARGAP